MSESQKRKNTIIAKVLIHDSSDKAVQFLKSLCDEKELIGLRAIEGDLIEFMLDPIISADISALFLMEEADGDGLNGVAIARRVHRSRKDLPIMLRLADSSSDGSHLSVEDRRIFSGFYYEDDLEKIRPAVEKYLFGSCYPISFVHSMQDVFGESIIGVLGAESIVPSTPFLVREHYMTYDLFCFIGIEAHWGKGYVVVESNKEQVESYLNCGHRSSEPNNDNKSASAIGEISNLIMGKVKSIYVDSGVVEDSMRISVPVVIDNATKRVSLGVDSPQLCFRFFVRNSDPSGTDVIVQVKMIFNIMWDPDQFYKTCDTISEMLKGGELELL